MEMVEDESLWFLCVLCVCFNASSSSLNRVLRVCYMPYMKESIERTTIQEGAVRLFLG
jgi:hypothetical protein